MNDHLQTQFTCEELQVALTQMAPFKFPSPNGFSAYFFQAYWPIVGFEVCKAVLQFLNEGIFDKDLNFTYIVLILKVKNPVNAKNFRLNNLSNVI